MGAAVSLSCSFVVPPTGCSPQAADLPKAPVQLHTTRLQHCPHRQQLPQPSCLTVGHPPWAAALAWAAPVGVSVGFGLQASSTAAAQAPLLLYVELCSVRCPWASPGLQGASALCLQCLLPSFCTDLCSCRAASLMYLTPLSQQKIAQHFFPALNALSKHCS